MSLSRPAASLLVLLCALFTTSASVPGDAEQGWSLSLESGAIARVPAAAFDLRAGERLRPGRGAERPVFRGRVRIDDAGRHRFALEAAGAAPGTRLAVRADGVELAAVEAESAEPAWTPWIDAPRGELVVELAFVRAPDAPARARVLWQRAPDRFAGFGPEPIPSRFVRPAEAPTEAAADRGRALLETKGCASCHAPSEAEARAVVLRPAPDLARVGARVRPDWLVSWIADPDRHRPHADMPDLFGDSEPEREDAEAIAHFLIELAGAPAPAGEPPSDAALAREGEALYHAIGCVACHGARLSQAALHDDPFLEDDVPGAPLLALGDVGRKWRRSELARFLEDPLATHPDGRMPSFALSPAEAEALAAALAPDGGSAAFEVDPERARRGRELFVARGCSACHALEGLDARTDFAALSALDGERGCLDAGPDASGPRYALTADERDALRAGLAAVARADGAPAPLDALARRLDALGCARCHAADGAGGVPEELDLYFVTLEEDTDLGDEGRLPPDLSGVGFKLETAWLDRVLVGDARARPWIAARMPRYGAAAEGLAELLARREGLAPHADAREPEATDELTLAGRELMDRASLSCIACHVYRDFPPSGTVGPDVAAFAERLRYEWFRAFLQDPTRLKPGTRMPSFQAPEGRSTVTTSLAGDLQRQIDALWCYFALGEAMPPPPGVARERGLPVAIGARPRVLRTFLEDAGARGIAVGFPAGVHFAYDAERARLVAAWRGDFLDASGAWAGRGGTTCGGRGPLLWQAGEDPPLVLLAPPDADANGGGWTRCEPGEDSGYRFRGYRLEPDGTPVFLTEIEDAGFGIRARVEERWTPHVAPAVGFDRTFAVELDPPGAGLLVLPGDARVARVAGADVLERPDADGALALAGAGGRIEIELEVRP